MNPITYGLLLVLAYFFYEAGAIFLAFLTIIVIILILISSAAASAPSAKAAAAGASPVVVQGPSMSIPPEIQFNPAWEGPSSGHESIGKRFGEVGGFFVKLFKKIFG